MGGAKGNGFIHKVNLLPWLTYTQVIVDLLSSQHKIGKLNKAVTIVTTLL